jgi:hypothetical protein
MRQTHKEKKYGLENRRAITEVIEDMTGSLVAFPPGRLVAFVKAASAIQSEIN